MRSFLELLKREIRLVLSDHSLLLTLLIAPILYAFFYGSIYSNKVEQKVKIGVVDNDGTKLSRTITSQINSTTMAKVISFSNLNDAKEAMFMGKTQGFLLIPEGLETKVLSLKQTHLLLALNTSRFLPSSDLTGTITKIALTDGVGVRLQYFKKQGNSEAVAMQESNPVHLDYRPLFNPRGSYGDFLLPGLLALILQQTLLIGLAESMASEREHNRLSEMLRLGKGSYSGMLWGKGLWYFLLFASYTVFFMCVNFNILHLTFRGNIWDLAFLYFVFLMTLIPLGLWIGSLFKSELLAMQVMAFSSYPIFLITGYSLPFSSLPVTVKIIADFIPTTPFLQAYQSIVNTGGSLADNQWHIYHLIGLWIFYCVLFVFRFRRLEKKQKMELS